MSCSPPPYLHHLGETSCASSSVAHNAAVDSIESSRSSSAGGDQMDISSKPPMFAGDLTGPRGDPHMVLPPTALDPLVYSSTLWPSYCPCCAYKRRLFTCSRCLLKGDFYHSDPSVLPEFADDKLKRLRRLKEVIEETRMNMSDAEHKKQRASELRNSIRDTKARVKTLKQDLKRNKAIKIEHQIAFEKCRKSNSARESRIPSFSTKAEQIRLAKRKYAREIATKEAVLNDVLIALSDRRRRLIDDSKIIFPLTNLPSFGGSFSTSFNPETTLRPPGEDLSAGVFDCLADAIDTSYVDGKWINTSVFSPLDAGSSKVEPQMQICSSVLPKSGDYSSYHQNKDVDYDQNYIVHHSHAITSGLQLAIKLLKYIITTLDAPVPQKCQINKVAWPPDNLNEYNFAHGVTKVNLTILYLCAVQGVDLSFVGQPMQTLTNLKHLVDEASMPRAVSPKFGLCFEAVPGPVLEYIVLKSRELTQSLKSIPRPLSDLIEDDEANWYQEPLPFCEEGWESVSNADLLFTPSVPVPQVVPPPSPSPSGISLASSVIANTATQIVSSIWGYGNNQ